MIQPESVCGVYDCPGCQFVGSGECPGCREANRQLVDAREQVCSILECAESHAVTSCRECAEPSCLLKRNVELICPMRSRFENTRWWAGRMSRALESRRPVESAGRERAGRIAPRVVSRLRMYLAALNALAEDGVTSVSSWQLAERVGVNAALIRKDLSKFGGFGTPSLGYRVDTLRDRIRAILGLKSPKRIVWIGAACFSLHVPALGRLVREGCEVVALFDDDPAVTGRMAGNLEVLPMERLAETMKEHGVHVAVLAVGGAAARAAADIMAKQGVRSILNVSGELLVLPDNITVSNVDAMGQLLELCYYSEN